MALSFLADTLQSITATTDATATTDEPTFVVGYVDVSSTVFGPGTNAGTFTGTTPVELIAPPAAATGRQVKSIAIYNADTVSHTFTLTFLDDIDEYTVRTAVIAPGGVLSYSFEAGWTHRPAISFLDALTRSIRAKIETGASTTNPTFVTGYSDIGTNGISYAPGSAVGSLTGATAVDIVEGPPTGISRQIKSIVIYNADTVTHDITIEYDDNGTIYTLYTFVGVLAGDTIQFTYETGWADNTTSSVVAFTDLTDVPSSYIGHAGDTVKVNVTEDGLEFVTGGGGGGGTWTDPDIAPPTAAIFSTLLNSATRTDFSQRGLSVTTASSGGTVVRGAVKSFTPANISIITRVVPTLRGGNSSCGLMLRDSSGGKVITFGPISRNTGISEVNGLKWNNINTVNGDITSVTFAAAGAFWLRLDYTLSGSTVDGYASFDGINWSAIFTGETFMTAVDQIGFYVWASASVIPAGFFTFYSDGIDDGTPLVLSTP